MGCSRPFFFFCFDSIADRLMLEIRCKHRSRIDNSRVPKVSSSFRSFASFFLSSFIPLSLSPSLSSSLTVQGLGSLLLCALPPKVSSFKPSRFIHHPHNPSVRNSAPFKPQTVRPFTGSPLSSALLFLPSFPPTRSLASLICLCINLLIPPINYFIKPFIGRSFILVLFFFSFGETFE